MYSNNPRSDKFYIQFPREFWVDEVMEKYDTFINLEPRVLTKMRDIIEESILGVSLPPFAQETPEQAMISSNSVWSYQHPTSSNDHSLLPDKTIEVSIRHTEGYLTYLCMIELFYYWFNEEHSDQIMDVVPVHILNESDEIVASWEFRKVIFKSIDGIDLKYSNPTTDFFDFTCTFVYSDFDIDINLPTKSTSL